MAFNGSGTFSRLFNWVTDKGNAVPVTASRMDSEMDGMATGLSTAICKDGQQVTTARIPFVLGVSAMQGAVGGVSYSFTNDADTGLYSPASGQWALACDGAQVLTAVTGGVSVSTGIPFTVVSGPGQFGGTLAVTGEFTASATATFISLGKFTSTSHMLLPSGTTGQRPGSPAAANARYNSTTNAFEVYNGTAWIALKGVPTFQTFTSGSAATYTTPTGATWLKIRMMGGGGGGGGSGTSGSSGGNAGSGGNTIFNSINATGGAAGAGGGAAVGTPGLGGSGGSGTATVRVNGGAGGIGTGFVSVLSAGGSGGSGFFGGSGAPSSNNGGAGAANTGGGGAGASSGTAASLGGGGGGSGEYVELVISNPSGTYTYTVGAGGVGGNPGAGGTGGAGAAGVIIVEEHYN